MSLTTQQKYTEGGKLFCEKKKVGKKGKENKKESKKMLSRGAQLRIVVS